MLIYVAHPYNGKEENRKCVEEKIKKLVKKYPRHTFISPIHSFGFMYNWVDDYEQGMEMCIDLLGKCDGLILCEGWEDSQGCITEKNWVEKYMDIDIYTYGEVLRDWKF